MGKSFEETLAEATTDVEKILSLEDEGWTKLGYDESGNVNEQTRINNVRLARRYNNFDPLAKQAIRLWKNYTFGTGISFKAENEADQDALELFWNHEKNLVHTSILGQHTDCERVLTDGEVFFLIFPGEIPIIRTLDTLEITEILTDPDDRETVLLYKREYTTPQNEYKFDFICDYTNTEKLNALDSNGEVRENTTDAVIYHLKFNTISQRGNSLLNPILDWIREYRRFLGSRVAIMLALTRFAYKLKIDGGSTAISAAKASLNDKLPQAGSTRIENKGSDLTPIKQDTGSKDAYNDARMLRLQICSGVGIPEQYFGDISSGNLATAKTVELPLIKQFQTFQQLWAGFYDTLFKIVLGNFDANIDIDFPPISPQDAKEVIEAIEKLVNSIPEFSRAEEIKQLALNALGINNVNDVLENLAKQAEEQGKTEEADNIKRLANEILRFNRGLENGKENLSKL